jgi:hypothetical protein
MIVAHYMSEIGTGTCMSGLFSNFVLFADRCCHRIHSVDMSFPDSGRLGPGNPAPTHLPSYRHENPSRL